MVYLTAQYNPWGVLASVLIAMFASYVALDLAKRVHMEARAAALTWWACGSLALGTGIWSMHFVGMLAFSLPIALGYTKLLTFMSWAAAVLVSAIALRVAGSSLSPARLILGALSMGGGICAMHYLGMAALDMTLGIVWDPWLVIASAVIAIAASAAALLIFSWLRSSAPKRILLHQVAAASVMGIAISGMHYTAMAAANFPAGTFCRSTDSLGGTILGGLVVILSVMLLALTLFASLLDIRRRLTQSLELANAQLTVANVELQKRSVVDPLTGTPNRILFEDRLIHAVARLERGSSETGTRRRLGATNAWRRIDVAAPAYQERIAVVFIDLDGFKPINDSFGHAAGDQVLIQVAQNLTRTARAGDTVARLGGDEFVVLMESVFDLSECERSVECILEGLRRPLTVHGHDIILSASIGIALYPDHGHRDELLVHADAAMYAAKRAGGNDYRFFERQMDAHARELLSLQSDLRRAVEHGEFELHYQPKFHSHRATGHPNTISGVEALIRWNHPQRGQIGPATFIPVAERIGLINRIGAWVIEEACRQSREWADAGLTIPIAVNISANQLRDTHLLVQIQQSLQRHDLDPSLLLCEITESAAMEDTETAELIFESMWRIGVYLSIDDFGTGYSSLSYLRRLPARQLKIDGSFVADLESSSDARAIVRAVVNLAHSLDLRVVAEGVETEAQKEISCKLGCDELQGYLLARPMPAARLQQWAAEHLQQSAEEDWPSTVVALRNAVD
jgi:diguanylate cyclase